MRKQLHKIIIGCMIGIPMTVCAQFNIGPGLQYGRTNTTMQKIGIGDFVTNSDVQAKLHINSFLLGSNPATDGFLFRTDGSQTIANRWDLYTGTSSTALQQRYSLFVDASTAASPFMVNQQANYGHFQFITADGVNGTNLHSRMRINGYSPSNTIQAFGGQNTSGFVAITADNNYWTDALSPKTPVSLLHLVGDNGGAIPFSYRPWMRNGISFTLGSDMGFIGPRLVNEQSDKFEMVLAWGDNPDGEFGPDVMSFRSMAGNGLGSGSTDDLLGSDMDGREVMRMAGNGNVGIGPRFNQIYIPQSTLHQHQENAASSWIQVSNQFLAGSPSTNNGPTAITASDGLRMGIAGNQNAQINGTAVIYNQEARPLLFSTNANTNTMNVLAGNTYESMRITSVATPTTLYNGSVGVYNPGGLGTSNNRVSISLSRTNPLTRPLSLLHLGTNLGTTNTYGWRNWMEIGTMAADKMTNAYFGLGYQASGTKYQGVDLAWGAGDYLVADDVSNPMPLRFVFSSNLGGAGNQDYGQQAGREVARMNSNGHVGIGTTNPHNRLEINTQNTNDPYWSPANMVPGAVGSSGLRFTRMRSSNRAEENPGEGVLSVDANGDVIYVKGGGGGSCEWDESGNDLFMGTSGACHTGNVGIGIVPAPNEVSRLNVQQIGLVNNLTGINVNTSNSFQQGFTYGIRVNTTTNGPDHNGTYGILSTAVGTDKLWAGEFRAILMPGIGSSHSATGCLGTAHNQIEDCLNIGVMGSGGMGRNNVGVDGAATGNNTSSTWTSTGVRGTGIFSQISRGVHGIAQGPLLSVGVHGEATQGQTAIGVFCSASGAIDNWALWANGDAYCNGGTWQGSDSNLKENIQSVENPAAILNEIQIRKYNFKTEQYPQLNLPSGSHFGVIAQQLQDVLPGLVKETTFPAQYDSLGTIISEAVTFKAVNYNELIPILIAGFQEQQIQIQTLQDQINSCCSLRDDTVSDKQGMITLPPTHELDIVLSNSDSPMLGFASPNPNRGEVYIDYYIPENQEGHAEMLFTDAIGRPMKTVRISERGNGRLNIDTANLAAGQYQYTLIVDGEIIATRKMIRE